MKKLLLLFVLCLCFPVVDKACTSIIITGKATPDGRPLMWKYRDTGAPYNHIGYFDEGGYRFLGLVNSDDYSHPGCNDSRMVLYETSEFFTEH